MATRRVISERGATLHGGGTLYTSPVLPTIWFIPLTAHRWLHDATFGFARVILSDGPGLGNTITFTLMRKVPSGAWEDTDVVVTFTGSETDQTSGTATASIPRNSYVTWRYDFTGSFPGAIDILTHSIVVDGIETGVSGYGGMPAGGPGHNNRTPLFRPRDWIDTSLGYVGDICSASGALAELAIDLTTAPGGDATRTFTVEEADTGVTVATITFSGSETAKSWVGALPGGNGDFLRIAHQDTGDPADATVSFATRWVAAIDGQSHFCGASDAIDPTSTIYNDPAGNHGFNVDPAVVEIKGGAAAYSLTRFRVRLQFPCNLPIPPFAALRGGTFSTLVNGLGLLAVVFGRFLEENQKTEDVDLSDVIAGVAPDDTLAVRFVPDNAPLQPLVSFGWIQTAFAEIRGAAGPLAAVHIRRRLPGSGIIETESHSNQSMWDPSDWQNGRKDARVESFGVAKRAASNRLTGEWTASTCDVTLFDEDLKYRGYLASSDDRYLPTRTPSSLILFSRESRAAKRNPFIAFLGPIVRITPGRPANVRLTLSDIIAHSLLASENMVPWRYVRDGFLDQLDVVNPELDPELVERILYGQHLRTEEDPHSPQGYEIVPDYLGRITIGGTQYHVGLICGHAIATFIRARIDGVEVSEGSGPWIFSNSAAHEGLIGTKYVDMRSSRYGNMRRYSWILGEVTDLEAEDADLTDPDAWALGKRKLTVAVEGTETKGDASGTVILDRAQQRKHFDIHYMARFGQDSYHSGLYEDHANPEWDAYGVRVKVIDEASYDLVSAIWALRYPVTTNVNPVGGFYPAGVIGAANIGARAGDRDSILKWAADWDRSLGTQYAITNLGQFRIVLFHPTEEIKAAAPLYTDATEILADSFEVGFLVEEQANRQPYRGDFDPAKAAWTTTDEASADASIANYDRDITAQPLEAPFAPGETMLFMLAKLRVALTAHPPRPVVLAAEISPETLEGDSLAYRNALDYIRYKHYLGIATDAFEIRLAQIQTLSIEPGIETSRVVAECIDAEDLKNFDAYQAPADAPEEGAGAGCASAIEIALDGTTFGAIYGTSVQPDDTGAGAAGWPFGATAYHGLWLKLTLPSFVGSYTLAVSTDGSDFDTQLAVFTGACGGLVLEASNDNHGLLNTSLVSLPATSGETYYILAAGASPAAFGNLHVGVALGAV